MSAIEKIMRSPLKPEERQAALTEAVCSGAVTGREMVDYFRSASYTDKALCAEAMKHISDRDPDLLGPHIDSFVEYLNHKAHGVMWGLSETIGCCAAKYPGKAALAVPYLLRNTIENEINTIVVRWSAACCLSEIFKHCGKTRKMLLPEIKNCAAREKNRGIQNIYLKMLSSGDKS